MVVSLAVRRTTLWINQERKRNMAKNMTRKGLALGVASAFVASGLASLPASASDEVLTLTPSAGSGYSTLSDSTFTLTAGFPATVNSDTAPYLSYRIQNPGLSSLTVDVLPDVNIDADKYGDAGSLQAPVAAAENDDDFVVQASAFTGGNHPKLGQSNSLTLEAASATEVTVTAFLDLNANNTIDPGEFYSPSRVISFVDATDVTGSVSMVTPQAGDETLTARVSFSDSNLNVRQIGSEDVLVQFGNVSDAGVFTAIPSFANASDGVVLGTVTTSTVTSKVVITSNNEGNNVVWNSALGVYEAVFNPVDIELAAGTTEFTALAGQKYGAKLFIDNGKSGSNGDDGTTDVDDDAQEGSTSVVTVGASASDYSIYWTAGNTENAVTTTRGEDDNGSINADGWAATGTYAQMAASVRTTSSGSSSGATFSVFVGTDVTKPVGVKSVSVKATFGTGQSISDDLTVDGLSVYTGQDRTFTKATDSNGFVTFDIGAAKMDAGDTMTVNLLVNGVEPSGGGTDEAVITFNVADLEIYSDNNLSGNEGLSIASGDTYSVDYTVIDQWGQAPANGIYRVVARDEANSSTERTTAANFAVSAPVVDGKATVTITDNGVGAGTYDLEAFWALVDGGTAGSDADDSVDTDVRVVADATPATVTIDALEADHYGSGQLNDANNDGDYSDAGDTDNRNKLVLETESMYTYLANTAPNSLSAPDLTTTLRVTIEGTVTNAADVAVPFAEVTLAAPNFLFVTNGNYVMDEITTIADASGDFSVDVYSKSGGVNNIVITSGAASATQKLTYAGAVSGAAADFTVTTPGASEPGRTVDVAVAVTDVNGNAVEAATVTLSSTGPGYLINTSGTTLSDGTFNTKLLLGANDSGTATIKVAMTIDGEEVIKTSTVVVGVGAVAEADRKVNAGSFKGYVAVYALGYEGQRLSAKIGNDWVIVDPIVNNQGANLFRVTDFTGAGVDIAVRIYIDRVLIDTINLTTK